MSIELTPVHFGRGKPSQASSTPGSHTQPQRRTKRRRVLATGALAVLTMLAGGMVYGLWVVKSISDHLPTVGSLNDVRINPPTTILSSDGVTLATIAMETRRPVALGEISPTLQQATIAVEDSRFYTHKGVDPRGIVRAIVSNVRSGSTSSQGASTLTQQLARNLYLSNEKTYRRKIAEILLARRIEAQYTKPEILEAYLNTAYYGNGCYGVEAAAATYFGKHAQNLTPGEATLLAGLPQRPLAFALTQHLDAALRRRQVVLARMVATGKMTPEQAQQTETERPRILRPHDSPKSDWKAPYFVSDVIRMLREKYGPEFLYSGVKIVTTLNWKMQQDAEAALKRGLPGGQGPNTGALVAIDPRTGFVRALVGGASFQTDQFDAVTQGIRQPGSAFKPFVYASAFDTNACDLTTEIVDQPLAYHAGADNWKVHNYDGRYRGSMTVLDGLRQSINTVAVQVMEKVGPANVADYATRMGITTPLDPVLPLALGASGVRPLDLCSAYSAFANNGNRYDPVFLQSITDANGREVFQDDATTRLHHSVLSANALDQINVGLREVVVNGTAPAAASIPDAHGKTGTTSSHRDAWFVGYNGDLAVAVWTAHVRKETVQQQGRRTVFTRYLPMGSATGGAICAPIWRNFMARALPEQRRVLAAFGLSSGSIAAPDKPTLLAALKERAKPEATDPTSLQAANKPPVEIPENGSAPETVTAPLSESERQSPDEVRVETSDEDRDQVSKAASGNVLASP
jgi:penicillin-binding protein 1A